MSGIAEKIKGKFSWLSEYGFGLTDFKLWPFENSHMHRDMHVCVSNSEELI